MRTLTKQRQDILIILADHIGHIELDTFAMVFKVYPRQIESTHYALNEMKENI